MGAVAMLRRLLRMIRHHLSGVQIRVRLDGGFAHPAVLEFLDAQPKLEYVVAMAKNTLLKRVVEGGMRRARQFSRRSGKTEHIYGEVRYKAGKWPGLRRVIIKAEVVRAADKDPKDNPRFVITNMKQSPQWIYERVYCQRGDIENRIKELHALEIDRTRNHRQRCDLGRTGTSALQTAHHDVDRRAYRSQESEAPDRVTKEPGYENGTSSDFVREAASRVLEPEGGNEVRRHHHSDEAIGRTAILQVLGQQRQDRACTEPQ